jgi:predicted ATPase
MTAAVTAGELERFESVQLFVERARYRRPGFTLDANTAASVAEICRRLDGIPLAIELAAARIGTLSAAQVSARLEHSLKLLASRDRNAPERQRTLKAALAWSYELLEEAEKELFAHLSVFAGGFTLEAAEAVCGGENIEEGRVSGPPVLDLLSRLVNRLQTSTPCPLSRSWSFTSRSGCSWRGPATAGRILRWMPGTPLRWRRSAAGSTASRLP